MDSSFTEHVLERARERQRKLQESSSTAQFMPLREANLILDRQQKISSSPQPNLVEFKKPCLKEVVSESGVGAKAVDPEVLKENCCEENIRVEVEIQETDSSDDGKDKGSGTQMTEIPGLREQAKNRLKKLGKLYAGGEDADISSPIQRTEEKFLSETLMLSDDSVYSTPKISYLKSRKGLSKLVDLAQNISQWEDDSSCTKKGIPSGRKNDSATPAKKTWKPPAPQPPVSNISAQSPSKNIRIKQQAPKPPITSSDSCLELPTVATLGVPPIEKPKENLHAGEVTPKQLKWDQAVLDTLESQGFMRSTSTSRLVYNYNVSQETPSNNESKLLQLPQSSTNTDKLASPAKKTSKQRIEIKSIAEEVEPERQARSITTENVITSKIFTPLNVKLEDQKVTPRSPAKQSTRSAIIANKAAIFESSPVNTTKENKDPAIMSIAEKKALFEKNKGAALLPKTAFGMAAPIKDNMTPKNTPNAKVSNSANNAKSTPACDALSRSKIPSPANVKSKVNKIFTPKPGALKDGPVDSPIKTAFAESGGIASKIAALIKNKNTIGQNQIENNVREQRQKEMEVLMNRFNRNKDINTDGTHEKETRDTSEDESEEEEATETTVMIIEKPVKIVTSAEITTPVPHSSREKRRSGEKRTKKSDSPQVSAVLEDVKRIKVTQPKEGRLYPCLSDIETATETEPEHTVTPSPNNSYDESFCSEESGADTSFGREILQAVCKNQTPQKRPIIYDECVGSDVSDILDDMDDYLDEAMAEEISDYSNGPTPPKVGRVTPPLNKLIRPSDSFHYKSFSPKVTGQRSTADMRSPMKVVSSSNQSNDLPTHVVDGDDVLPLTHTVSFYRRQQTQVKTPVRQISRQAIIEEGKDLDDTVQGDDDEVVGKKIEELLDEVNRQQMIISQTSQALNLCNVTPEFMGSTEQVEAEKVLLLATHRRQVCLNEVQRLRVEKTLRPQGQHSQHLPLERGALTLSNISLPLKKEYMRALAAAGGKGHHVVCLIKCGEQALSTQLVSTVANSCKNPDPNLNIPGTVRLDNIFSDFTVTFEVYCLQAQEEVLPHEVKYHINKKAGSKLTPRKARQESRMIRPPKESPGGPNIVRTSTFALMGYVVFSIQAVHKKQWSLNKAPPMSPLEGSVNMKISCELATSVEYKGFLTMFEDVSGFGAWHRRWCLLNGDTLSYWKYPDDEKKRAPIDSINLRSAITDHVGPVSRDICARLHTLLIERERKAEPHDKESLIVIRKGDKTIIRHLLSADTKEERIEWCNVLNRALTALKMWGTN